jgi:hypothetical protein
VELLLNAKVGLRTFSSLCMHTCSGPAEAFL